MAEFGAQVTNVGETQNFVTPQQGIRDDSLATIIGGLGNAAAMGVETYATSQTNKFAKNYEEVTRIALGGEALSPDEKQFKERMDRIQQTSQLGKTDTAKILREEFLRKSIGEKPWLATRFEQMAGRVDGRYTDLIAAFQQVEAGQQAAAAAAQAQVGKDRKSIITRLEKFQAELGGIPATRDGRSASWEDLTDEERRDNDVRYQNAITRKRLLEALQKDEDTAYTRETRGIDLATKRISFDRENRTNQSKDVAANIVDEYMDRFFITSNTYAANNPNITQEQLAVQGAQFINQTANQLRGELVRLSAERGVILSPTDIDNYVQNFTNLTTTHKDTLTGPAASASVLGRQAQAVSDSAKLAGSQLFPLQTVMAGAGIDLGPMNQTMLQSFFGTVGGVNLAQSSGTELAKGVQAVLNGEFRVSNPPTAAEFGTIAGTTNLLIEAAKTGTQSYLNMLRKPEAFVPFLTTGAKAYELESNPTSKDLIYSAMVNPAIISSIAKASPALQEQATEGIRQATQIKVGYAGNPGNAGKYVAGYDPQTRQFTPADDSAQAKNYVKVANSVIGNVLMLEQAVNNNTDPYSVIRMYFGPSVADKVESAQEQPQ